MIMNLKLSGLAKNRVIRKGINVGVVLTSVFSLALATATVQRVSFAQPQTQRDRRVATEPTPTPIPSPATSSIASRSIPASRNAPATLAELQTRIQEIVRQPALEPGFFAVKIVSLDTGMVIYEQSANKFTRPASNMKLYTVAAAFDRLTPDYHFMTSVYAKEKPDDGKVKGDLIVYGRGDPSFAARFNGGDYFKGIDDLAGRIVAAGVKRVKGDLVGDESYFNGAPLGSGWEWDDLQWSYGAQVSALTVNDNSIDLTVKPGEKVGAPVVITSGPPATFMTIANRATTGARGSKNDLNIYRGLGANTLEISGSLPLGDNGFTGSVAIPDPALAFVSMLREALVKRGVKIDGRVRTVDARSAESIVPNPLTPATPSTNIPPQPVEITSTQSPPFSLIASHTLKPSQNLYTEIILRTLGKLTGVSPSQTNEEAGLIVVRNFLRQAGANESDLALNDGSGLSRNDMITANATVQLLTYMSKHRYFAQFRDALPIAGVDGTLRTRMRGTPAEGNLRAKTGSLSSVASLSGYVTTAAGERLVFSMMLNNYPDAGALRRDSIDAIAVLLASFAGRSQ
jgi:D-alanyl-D-alanine carboxypeptidase/D-alanyl-D-alanine-endopeptidase (penicillin-binding protein 4)